MEKYIGAVRVMEVEVDFYVMNILRDVRNVKKVIAMTKTNGTQATKFFQA